VNEHVTLLKKCNISCLKFLVPHAMRGSIIGVTFIVVLGVVAVIVKCF